MKKCFFHPILEQRNIDYTAVDNNHIGPTQLYSQTCSNNHLYKTTTRLRRPVLSPPQQIPIELLLYNMTTCLKQPATTFCLPSEKNLSKTTTTKLYLAKKWKTNIRQQCIKANVSLYSSTTFLFSFFFYSLFNVDIHYKSLQ